MAAILPVNLGIHYAKNVLRKFYHTSIIPEITNSEYEGTLKGGGADRLKMIQFLNDVSFSDYTEGSDMTAETWMGDTETSLIIDQRKYYNFAIDDVNRFEAYARDIDSALIENAAGKLKQLLDSFILHQVTDNAKVGHRLGSNMQRDSACITSAGALIGASDQTGDYTGYFTGAMQHYGIRKRGGATWYRIGTYTDSGHLTVTDWNSSTYTGGDTSWTNTEIECQFVLTVTSSNLYGYICTLAQYLDEDDIPKENRWLVIPPSVAAILKQDDKMVSAVDKAYEQVIEKGHIGYVAGFKVYESNYCEKGPEDSGYICPAGHKSAICFAHAIAKSRVVEDVDQFRTMYQGLHVYGAAVPIERRKALAFGWFTT